MSKGNGDRYCYGVQRERKKKGLVVLVRKWHRIKAVAI